MKPAARLVLLLAPVLTRSDPPTQVKPPAKRLNPYAAAGSSRPKSTNPYAKPPTKRRILDEGVGNGAEAAAAQDMGAEIQGQLPWAAAGAAVVETSQVRCLPGRNFKQLEDTQAAGHLCSHATCTVHMVMAGAPGEEAVQLCSVCAAMCKW